MVGINPELLRHARYFVDKQAELEKAAFVDTSGMGGGAAPGGAPPADPAAGGGGDPAAAGGGGGGIDPMTALQPMIQSAVQAALAGQGGAAGGAAGGAGGVEPIKPKIDVNVELMQLKKMIAKICDSMGIVIPASDMAVTSQDLTQMAQQQSSPPPAPQSSISPISPIQGASPELAAAAGGGGGGTKTSQYGAYRGEAVPSQMDTLSDKAAALSLLIRANRQYAN